MRILVVQESGYLERGPHQGHHLLERMVQRGHEVRVIDFPIDWKAQNDGSILSPRIVKAKAFKAVAPGVTVIRPAIIQLPALSYISLLVTHSREISRQIREFNPDVIVGFGLLNASISIRLARRHNIPFIYYVIDELHRLVPEAIFKPIAKAVEMSNNRLADKVISINQGLKEYTEEMGAEQSKTKIIRAGVSFDKFALADGTAIRQRFGFNDEDTVLFFMGWLYDFSGLDEIALSLARSDNKHLKMLVLGKGGLWDRLNDIKNQEGLGDRLILEGWKPYDEVPSYVAAADICLLPAKRIKIMENIVPIKMYEYLAAGKVVFATGLSGIRKEFGTGNGVMYINSPEEVIPLAEKIRNNGTLVTEGKNGQAFVRPNDWDRMTNEFESLLQEACQS